MAKKTTKLKRDKWAFTVKPKFLFGIPASGTYTFKPLRRGERLESAAYR